MTRDEVRDAIRQTLRSMGGYAPARKVAESLGMNLNDTIIGSVFGALVRRGEASTSNHRGQRWWRLEKS